MNMSTKTAREKYAEERAAAMAERGESLAGIEFHEGAAPEAQPTAPDAPKAKRKAKAKAS